MGKRLRSGFTTGACAAAAAKAAAILAAGQPDIRQVAIPFPDGSRHQFAIHRWEQRPAATGGGESWTAAVIKDAGDDPDVTNGAEITATVTLLAAPPDPARMAAAGRVCQPCASGAIWLGRGEGVGMVTRPGLAVQPGEPAINPVPRQMIAAAVAEVWPDQPPPLLVSIAIPAGERLAAKTLNRRLGIVGGLSVLGTTGIVRPVSAEAWTATIQASLDVARAAGLREVILATGRTSEKGVQRLLDLPEEACAMMGDYLHFSLQAAGQRGFEQIHLAGMWAKIVKAALEIPQTHVRHGALEVRDAVRLLGELGAEPELAADLADANTAREILARLQARQRDELITAVCRRAARYATGVAGVPVRVYLVDSDRKVLTMAADGQRRVMEPTD